MYTLEQLDSFHYTKLQKIAEESGLEYTTKDETIAALLELPSEEPEPMPPAVSAEPVAVDPGGTVDVDPEETFEIPSNPPSYWARIGMPVGSDGQKIRYSLDGRRLN